MNSTELVEAVATAQGVTKTDVKKILDGLVEAIATAAAKGEEISINGFGKFKVKESPAREGRNPRTGEPMSIAASRSRTSSTANSKGFPGLFTRPGKRNAGSWQASRDPAPPLDRAVPLCRFQGSEIGLPAATRSFSRQASITLVHDGRAAVPDNSPAPSGNG